jgi:glycosyltransferase involved in cell wall biosynthesis
VPKVSAVIATHNRADYVLEAVESVLAQVYEDVELIVVDDGSTDGTLERLAPFADRLRVVVQEHSGRAVARNTGLREAQGEYVSFLDSDDRWLPDKLARLVPVLDDHPGVALVHGQVDVIDTSGNKLAQMTAEQRRAFSKLHSRRISYAGYALHCLCFTSATVMRTETMRAVGGYDPAIAMEDLDLYLRLALDYELLFVDGPPVAEYRLHDTQTPSVVRSRGEIQACEKNLAIIAGRPQQAGLRLARRNLHLKLSSCHHVIVDPSRTRHEILRAVRLDPRALAVPGVLRRLVISFLPRRWRRIPPPDG